MLASNVPTGDKADAANIEAAAAAAASAEIHAPDGVIPEDITEAAAAAAEDVAEAAAEAEDVADAAAAAGGLSSFKDCSSARGGTPEDITQNDFFHRKITGVLLPTSLRTNAESIVVRSVRKMSIALFKI